MVSLEKIKLIIWDLDQTFWKGVISEGEIEIPRQHKELLEVLSKRGIVNSICSKNDFDVAWGQCKKEQIDAYFVFPSINWEAKGGRIAELISQMNLRAENVLFLDDEAMNLAEAEFVCPGIMTSKPEEAIPLLIKEASHLGKDDSELSRLKQYHNLEKKVFERKEYQSNEEFLRKCEIQIQFCNDVEVKKDRVFELIQRTNQLNFTKKRDTIEEFEQLLSDDSVEKGYVTVSDKFGDYGICGFYALKDQELIHFLFSCRTMGMGIEQYVYAYLGYPKLQIAEPVSGTISKDEKPDWIREAETVNDALNETVDNRTDIDTHQQKIMIKGPCDLDTITIYLKNRHVVSEFFFTDEQGRQVELQTHFRNMCNILTLTENEKEYLSRIMPFYHEAVFQSKLFEEQYSAVILSVLPNFNFGVYQNKSNPKLRIALGQNYKDITKEENWEGYISGKIYNGRYQLTREQLKAFSEDFEKIEYSEEDIWNDICMIREKLGKKTIMVLLLGSEVPCEIYHEDNYENRDIRHLKFNQYIQSRIKEKEKIFLVNPTKYIQSQSDYLDFINHYSKKVTFSLAEEVNRICESQGVNVGLDKAGRIKKSIREKLKRFQKQR